MSRSTWRIAGVGVREDRRDRQQHQRERQVREADADVGDEERDQREARHRAADVRRVDREEAALADVPEPEPERDRERARDRHRDGGQLRCSRISSQISRQAADLRPAGGRLALVEDEVDRVAELAEEGDRRGHRAATARVQGVIARCTSRIAPSSTRRQQHSEAAGDDHVRLERDVGEDLLAEPAGAGEERERGQAHRGRHRDPQAGHDLRQRERDLDAPEQLAVGQAHAAAGVLGLVGHVVEPRQDVAEDDQQHVGDERDQRRVVAAPGDRQQQEEGGDARDRVEDAGDLGDRADQPAAPVRDDRERERDQRSRSPTASTVSKACWKNGST